MYAKTEFSLGEAKLFRALTAIFGHDQVIPWMSVAAVCEEIPTGTLDFDYKKWAETNYCQMTVVNQNNLPVLVVELFERSDPSWIDAERLEHTGILEPMLAKKGILYIALDELTLDRALSHPDGNGLTLLLGEYFGFDITNDTTNNED